MPFAPRIRKDILKALDDYVIPALWKPCLPLGYAAAPLQFPRGIHQKLANSRLPRRDSALPGFPIQSSWTKAKLHATAHPYLSFIYEGHAEERTLITAAQSYQYKIDKGIYMLHAQAPSVLFFPAGVPRNTGAYTFFESNSSLLSPTVKILQLAFRDKVLVHIHTETMEGKETSHSLQVNDVALLSLANLIQEELRNAPESKQEIAQAALLTLMLRLRNQLALHPPNLANTSHPPTVDFKLPEGRGQEICQKAIHFIQTHLHEPLSLSQISREVSLSPVQLNRHFRNSTGVPVMCYVRQQRINAAKKILIEGSESIKEIAVLLNFKRAAAFCSVFRYETGMTPLQFRRQFALSKSTFAPKR